MGGKVRLKIDYSEKGGQMAGVRRELRECIIAVEEDISQLTYLPRPSSSFFFLHSRPSSLLLPLLFLDF